MSDLNLSDDQKDSINKIYDWSNSLGIDPKFALSVAYPESGVQHIPASDPESTAYGPFQVNKATAAANGVDYEAMKKSKDLALWTGLKNLQRHAENPELQGDPSRILAAHRFGENSAYAKSGDPADITPQLADFFTRVGSVYGDEMPSNVYKKPADSGREESHSLELGTPQETEGSDQGFLTPKQVERIVGGTGALTLAGLGSGAVTKVGLPIVNSISQMRAANALAKLKKNDVASSVAEAGDTTGPAPTSGKGSKGWLEGRRADVQSMPDAIANQVTTLKGQGQGSASYAEAQNAARIQKLIDMGYDPLSFEHSPSGVITGGPGIKSNVRQDVAPPVAQQAAGANAPIGSQVGQGQGTVKNAPPAAPSPSYMDYAKSAMDRAGTALEPAANFLKHPLTRAGSATFGMGAMLPEMLEHLSSSQNKTQDIAKDAATGAALGVAPTVLPEIMQAGLRRVGPVAAAIGNEYDAWNRRKSDPTGAAISGVGGLAALAPFALSGPVGWGLGATGMLAPPVINYLRDKYGHPVATKKP
jgi:hypothetical protein